MPKADTRWYVVHTQARAERLAENHLKQQDYRVFCPVMKRETRHARKVKSVLAPLFLRYIFTSFNPARDRWLSINSTVGVLRLITANDRPQALPNGLVETLMDMPADGAGSDQTFQPGQNVQLLGRQFTEFVGQIRNLDDKGRVQVLLEIMGRVVPVTASTRDLIAINA